jgi:F0F1-type ATP synthase assembly protein I
VAGELGRHAGHGLTLAAATALFAWLGLQADERLGTGPLLVVVGAALGFGTGFYSMYRALVGGEGGTGAGSEEDGEAGTAEGEGEP